MSVLYVIVFPVIREMYIPIYFLFLTLNKCYVYHKYMINKWMIAFLKTDDRMEKEMINLDS